MGRADVYERMRSWLLGSGATWARWTALRLLRLVDLWRARSAPEPSADKVRILLFHAYGMGGTIRTVLNLAGYLAHGHDVEIVSLIRAQHRPFFPIPPGVKVSFLDDRTERKGRTRALLSRLPSVLVPSTEPTYRRCSLWTDLVLLRYLRSLRGGVLITTRPSLNLFAASFAPPEVITIGQEHRNLAAHKPPLRKIIVRRYGRLDVLVTLTRADLEHYARAVPNPHLVCIPNALPPLGEGRAWLEGTTAVALGRLERVKGFDLLLTAWRLVCDRRPEWTLRIYGSGPWMDRLKTQIDELDLTDRAFLMGRTDRVGEELSKAAMFLLSSRSEGMPMALIEAMSKGLPAVAFDCPTGPGEIITDGVDGRLVEPKNVEALAEAICELIDDQDLRRKLGAAAQNTAAAYDLQTIGSRWDTLLAEAVRRRTLSGSR
ncbi:glycosyltransferase family 4 protein [Streptosporangium lutulentum]|uniref:Glycosyltransferase involved in cell wall biosynthesis n=1 Tax=Streptosporangium lutulentum TaxID=1461250 RepID=A0ABT9Q427_9ACTN|nr:glycosyltransferase family 4 protein [Streptosporangium lutulentum]MDP9841481.1 glycosyltransferase involved in cell wall biosynthesis [Streptosporangium lutulentum]